MFQRLAGKLILKRSLQQSKPQYSTFKNSGPHSKKIYKVIKYGAIAGAILVPTSFYFADQWSVRRDVSKVTKAFSSKIPFNKSPGFIERSDSALEKAVTSGPPLHNYFVVTGENYSGTSTLVEHLASEANEKGSVMVSLLGPSDIEIAVSLANAFNVNIGVGSWKSQNDNLSALLNVIEEGAAKYAKETKSQPVLIIDDFERLATANDATYHKLLNKASEWSKSGTFRVVFVMSNNTSAMLDNTVFPPTMEHIRTSTVSDADVEKYVRLRGDPELKNDPNLPALVKDSIGGNLALATASKDVILQHQASATIKVNKVCRQDKRVLQVLSMVQQAPGLNLSDITKKGADLEGVVKMLIQDGVLVMDLGNRGLYFRNRAVETAVSEKIPSQISIG